MNKKLMRFTFSQLITLVLLIGGSWGNTYVRAEETATSATPDLRGTWNMLYEAHCEPDNVYEKGSSTMTITHQVGGIFKGYGEDQEGTWYFNGAVVFDQVRITEEVSVMTGTLVNPDTIIGTGSELPEPDLGHESYCSWRFKADRVTE